jgi:hypothetical protein
MSRVSGLTKSSLIGLCLGLLTLAACVDPAPAVDVTPGPFGGKIKSQTVPTEVVDYSFEAAVAKEITKRCWGKFRFNFLYYDAVQRALEQKYDISRFAMAFDAGDAVKKEFQGRVFAYVERRGIILGDYNGWCKAGAAEVAEQSRIAKFLLPL